MSRHQAEHGFTAVELLVAMLVGVLLLGSAYQLYGAILQDSGEVHQRAVANTFAYAKLRQAQKNPSIVKPFCSTYATTSSVPTSVGISPRATYSIDVTCPYGTNTALSRIAVTVDYFTPNAGKVVRAITVTP